MEKQILQCYEKTQSVNAVVGLTGYGYDIVVKTLKKHGVNRTIKQARQEIKTVRSKEKW